MDQSESPNEHLFKLLLENMERLNDREVTLTEEDWNRFLQHLSSRPRHGIPLPFPAELCPAEQQDGGSKKSKAGKPLVKWRCFVRAVTALGCGRLILTFLPASLKYVKLMGRHGRRRSSSATNNRLCTPEQEEKNAKEVDRSTLSIGLLSRGSSEGLLRLKLLLFCGLRHTALFSTACHAIVSCPVSSILLLVMQVFHVLCL